MQNIKRSYRTLTVIFLLPLFFINVKDSHDWGDDFAQYLIQARNIVEGRPQTENGLLVNEKDPVYAIEAYPVGIPLLIAPIYYFSKLKILPYCILFSVVLFITGIFSFEFFRRRTTELTAMFLTLLFCYNASIIELKKQILSEIPFTCLLIFLLIWPELKIYRKNYSWLITGLLFALLVSTRVSGLSILISFIIFEIKNIFVNNKLQERNKNISKLIFSLVSALIIFFLLNQILFPIKSGNLFGFYSNAFSSHELQASINLDFYYTVAKYLFPFYGSWIPSFWIIIALCGWLLRFIKNSSFSEYVLPLYSLVIIFYPYSNAGLRFIIPILPLLLFYSWYFIYWLFSLTGETAKWISAGVLIIVLSAYVGPLINIISTQPFVEEGPQQKESIELFNYLKSTPPASAVVFCKARAITLYSGHPSLYTAKNESNEDAFVQFHRYNLLYLVIANVQQGDEIYDPGLLNFISLYKNQYELVWENRCFNVYRQR